MKPGLEDNPRTHSTDRVFSLSPKARAEAQARLLEIDDEREDIERQRTLLKESLEYQEKKQFYLENFFEFCIDIMGFTDLYEPFHGPLCKSISDGTIKRKLYLWPRGHFKTTIISICYPAWLLCRDPTERIILASVNADKAEENLSEIVDRISSPDFQYYFSNEVGHPDSWPICRKDNVRINRPRSAKTGSSIRCLGVESGEVGRHCSVFLGDDIVGKEQVNTHLSREKVWNWFGRQLAVLDPGNELIILGTHWHGDDPYSRIKSLKKKDDWLIVSRKIREPWPTGPFIFPTRFNQKVIDELLEIMDTFTFSCFYLNDPIGEGLNPFEVGRFSWIEYNPKPGINKDKTVEDAKHCKPQRYILVDPATTMEEYSCPTGIIIGDALPSKKFVIIEAISEKLHPDRVVDLLFDLVKTHDPTKVVLEAEAQQRTFHYWIRQEMFRRKVHFRLDEARNPRNTAKHSRLLALQPLLHKGAIVFWKDMKGKEHIINEFSSYPKGRTDDCICALYLMLQTVTFPPKFSRPSSRNIIPKRNRTLHRMLHEPRRKGRMPRVRVGGLK